MPSKQSEAVEEHWRRSTRARQSGAELDDEAWGDLTAEPRGVDYIETDEPNGLPGMWAIPKDAADDRVLLCIHGGGFVSGSIYTHRKLFGHLAKAVGARSLLVHYRFAPEHPHPAQVDETTAAYRWLLDQGVSPRRIALAGDSSGGGLAITTQLRAREQGLPLPAAAILISPWVDLELTGQTYESNRDKDAFFYREVVQELADLFLAGGSPRDPLANPLYADLTELGPVHVQVGGDETLLDDARYLAEHADKVDVEVELDIVADMQHTFQMAAGRAPEADAAIHRLAEWARPKLGLPATSAGGQ